MLCLLTDRTFYHSGASKSYQDTGVDLTGRTWVVLQVTVNYYQFRINSERYKVENVDISSA